MREGFAVVCMLLATKRQGKQFEYKPISKSHLFQSVTTLSYQYWVRLPIFFSEKCLKFVSIYFSGLPLNRLKNNQYAAIQDMHLDYVICWGYMLLSMILYINSCYQRKTITFFKFLFRCFFFTLLSRGFKPVAHAKGQWIFPWYNI